jgi:hypothetical protein
MPGEFIRSLKQTTRAIPKFFARPFVCFTSFYTVISEYDRTIYSPIDILASVL